MFFKKLTGIFFHLTGWLLLIGLVLGFVNTSSGTEGFLRTITSGQFLLFIAVFTGVFYINTSLLLPGLYLKKKYLLYILAVFILFAIVYYLTPFDRLMHHGMQDRHGPFNRGEFREPPRFNRPPREKGHTDIISVILFFMVWLAGVTVTSIRQWRETEQRAALAEADKANAELSFLKARVNPHFLFNTLNNIYSMSVSQHPNTPASILKLSNIMRYISDEATQDYVPLSSEAACISDYIDLQKLRLSSKVILNFNVNGEFEGKTIAPLLLMTFIENVFKHGISNHEPSDIIIDLAANDKMVRLHCENRKFENKLNLERKGVGIENARQRLDYLYKNRYSLKIENGETVFTVHLQIDF